VLLIFNPVAARTDPKVVTVVSRVFTREGWDVDVAGTTRPGHAAELARQGVADGVSLVAVYGGDGTTMQAVSGMIGTDVPIALIPGGTGNLLAGNLRVPRDPAAAARAAACGTPRRIDLGRLERPEGPRYFAVACGAGFDAELMGRTSEEAKRRWRMGAYVAKSWEVAGELRVVPHTIWVDGRSLETQAAMVLVANCGELIPPFFRLREGIAPDDGAFDVVIVNASSMVEGMDAVWHILTGQVNGNQRLQFVRGAEVRVDAATPRPVQLDGELAGETPFRVTLLPKALGVITA
jgi:YegS/Rv2252/BmrU family lipid kinase